MRTSKPIATISYNSEEFLRRKLEGLAEKGKIDFWCYINHLPEADEKKEHKHLFVVPSGLIDTACLLKELEEVSSLSDIPLKCMPFRNSKFGDWYLYALHDKDYLDSKLDAKKYHYSDSDMFVSDESYFAELIHTSDFTKFRSLKLFKQLVASGMSFGAILERGVVPVNLICQFKTLYNELTLDFERDAYVIDKSAGVVRDSVFNTRFGRH